MSDPLSVEAVRTLTAMLPVMGCCLHIVVEDGNIGDDSVQFCVDYAQGRGWEHRFCYMVAICYLLMTKHERALVLGHSWCPTCMDYTCCDRCHDCDTLTVEIPKRHPDPITIRTKK
jgi:hypothetical protein